MIVYPVNKVQGHTAINSSTILSYSDIRNIYHPYMKHRAYFSNTGPTVTMTIPITGCNALIIGDTNCIRVAATIVSGSYTFSGTFNLSPDILNVIPVIASGKTPPWASSTANVTLVFSGTVTAYVGYVFIGTGITLPRFVAGPEWETTIRGDSQRTGNGQAYGQLLPTLDVLRVKWMRIYKNDRSVIDSYVQAVQNVIPHVVNLYPDAVTTFPARYATIYGNIVSQKRNESDFFWNIDIEWMEAR